MLLIMLCFILLKRQALWIFLFQGKQPPAPAADASPAKTRPDVSREDLEMLRSLPYANWSQEKAEVELKGVVRHDREKAFPGTNVFTDNRSTGYLMDMTGKIIHRWRFPRIPGQWEHIELLENGMAMALCVEKCLCKLGRDSRLIWLSKIKTNHDIAVLSDGSCLVPHYPEPVLYNGRPVRFDSVAHFSASGEMLDVWSSSDHLEELQKIHGATRLDSPPTADEKAFEQRKLARRKKDLSYEYYHLNTVEILPKTGLGSKDKRFQAGNYLLCLRNVSLILILDKETKKIVWSWGPEELDWPHTPSMLENGNILIFDNGAHRTYSRVIEIVPTTGQIVWEYKANPLEAFYSRAKGSSQRLPNGNTLICESEKGRVFEVTRQGEIVWEFYNPNIRTRDGKRRQIYRMTRVLKKEVDSWLRAESK